MCILAGLPCGVGRVGGEVVGRREGAREEGREEGKEGARVGGGEGGGKEGREGRVDRGGKEGWEGGVGRGMEGGEDRREGDAHLSSMRLLLSHTDASTPWPTAAECQSCRQAYIAQTRTAQTNIRYYSYT